MEQLIPYSLWGIRRHGGYTIRGVGYRLSVDSLPDDLPEQGQCTRVFFDPKLRGFLMKNFPLANP